MAIQLSTGLRTSLFSGAIKDTLPQWLDEKRHAFEQGEKFSLYEVLLWCGIFQAVIPEWAVDALIAIKEDVDHGRILDAEAFGNALGPPGRPVARARRTTLRERNSDILMMLGRLRTEGYALDNSGFDAAKERLLEEHGLNLSRKDIEDVYKAAGKDWLKKIPQGHTPQSGLGIIGGSIPYSELKMKGRSLLKNLRDRAPDI